MTTALQSGSVSVSGTLAWKQTKAITGFISAEQNGPLQVSATIPIGTSDANQVYPVQGTLAPSASVTINLNGLTMPAFGDILNPSRVYALVIKGTGAPWSIAPGAVSGVGWLMLGTSPSMNRGDGAFVAIGDPTAGTIDGSKKNITITNLSSLATLTYTLATILGA